MTAHKIDTAEVVRVAREIADSDPTDEWNCAFCGFLEGKFSEHKPTCPWLRLRAALGIEEGT